MSQESNNNAWLLGTLQGMQAEIDRLRARVAQLECHPAMSVPPLKIMYDPFRPSNTGDAK